MLIMASACRLSEVSQACGLVIGEGAGKHSQTSADVITITGSIRDNFSRQCRSSINLLPQAVVRQVHSGISVSKYPLHLLPVMRHC